MASRAFTRRTVSRPSKRLNTGFQYTPVDSRAAWVTPSATSQAARACRAVVCVAWLGQVDVVRVGAWLDVEAKARFPWIFPFVGKRKPLRLHLGGQRRERGRFADARIRAINRDLVLSRPYFLHRI